jgi:Beta-galactosidase trimerisation domain
MVTSRLRWLASFSRVGERLPWHVYGGTGRLRGPIGWAHCMALLLFTAGSFAESNVAPFSRVTSRPYVGRAISYLTDGSTSATDDDTMMMRAPLPLRVAHLTPVEYDFVFPRRVAVTKIRLLQRSTRERRAATGFIIDVDIEGHGRYDKTVVVENDARPDDWLTYAVSPPIPAYGLRFRTTSFAGVSGPSHGAPVIEEFEIFTNADLGQRSAEPLPPAPLLQEDSEHGRALQASSGVGNEQFQRGLFGSMWLYWSAGKPYSDQANEQKLGLLRRLKVNRFWLYPGVDTSTKTAQQYLTLPRDADYRYFIDRQISRRSEMTIVPFPSTVVPGYRTNVLARFVAQMHRGGVRVIANESLLPFGVGAWDFPRVIDPKLYPSVLSSRFVREASTTLYKEFMEAGVDGLALGGDEFFLYGDAGVEEDAAPICKDETGAVRTICRPTSKQLFRQRFGADWNPSHEVFSPLAGKWTTFKYEQLGELFATDARMMKSINPQAIVTSLFRPGQEERPAYGVAYDVMGSVGMVEEMSSDPYWSHDSYLGHYYFANETKKLIGASGSRKATITLQTTPTFNRNGYRDPEMVYGPAFSALMHGVSGINFYKQDYLFAGGDSDAGPWVERFFNLTAVLEAKGLLEHRVPRTVALLYSRASEDWWAMTHATDPIEAAEATLYQNAVMEVLFRNGVPFDLYYLDQPSSFDDIGSYSLILLPYPYSISNEAVARLRRAVDSGSKVVSFQRSGEVDEFGGARPQPALSGLSGIEHSTTPLTGSSYDEFSAHVMRVIVDDLNGRLPLQLDANGHDVECAPLTGGDGQLVFCLNWEKRDVDINLGLDLKDGTYTVSVITMERETRASIGGASRLEASDLRRFRLPLAAGQPKILSVVRVGDDGPGAPPRRDGQ